MNVLVVLPRPPHPEGGAADRCSTALLEGLRANGVTVRALAARPPEWQFDAVAATQDVEIVEVSAGDDLGSRLARVRYPTGSLRRGPFGSAVRAAAADADVVHLETLETAWCDTGETPALVRVHYLPSLDGGGVRSVEYVLAERLALRRRPELLASSSVVAGKLRSAHPRAHVDVSPLGLDPQRYPAAPLDGPPRAGFIGTGSWPPTARALRELVEGAWPRVRSLVPDARLTVAGRGLDIRAGSGVEVAGEVPSAAEFLRGLSVLLYPLERGSGMKVKTLESLAVGLPVVTTPAGAEGIVSTEGIVVADEPRAFVEAAAMLLRDASERRSRGAAGRATFTAHYTPAASTRALPAVYERVAARRSSQT